MIILAEETGRLGNRVILFAHLIAFCREHGLTLLNPSFGNYADFFIGTSNRRICRYPSTGHSSQSNPDPRRRLYCIANLAGRTLRRAGIQNRFVGTASAGYDDITEGDVNLDDPAIARPLLHARHSFLFGFRFRCYDLFAKHQDEIRAFFSPSPPVANVVTDFIARSRKDVDRLVGVHIRQGDYADFQGGQLMASVERFAFVMNRLNSELTGGRVRFVICSDGPVDLSAFAGLDVVPGPGDIATDLFTLASCDNLIATKSTFSRWASFFGRVPLLVISETQPQAFSLADFKAAIH